MSDPIRLVLVEDDRALREVLGRELADLGFEVRAWPSADGVCDACGAFDPDVALVDLRLPGIGGLDLLRELRERHSDVQAVMLTGHGGVPEAVEAMRLGAYDFLVKPTPIDVVDRTLRRAADRGRLLRENRRLRRAAAAGETDRILGDSASIAELRSLVERLGPVEAPVLIQGENGTGKELIARHLHRYSGRAARPCLVLNCGGVPSDLVESELFGHERGAFTGADRAHVGLFEAADGGSLLLDEVGELPLAVQPTLLRVLQFGEVRPVGSTRTRKVDVRILAATNRDLPREIAAGRFREDLYYRLATFRVEVPPLRQRPGDVALLARTFLARACERAGREVTLDPPGTARLAAHAWPGNVRELENAMIRLSVLAPEGIAGVDAVERIALERALPSGSALPTLRIAELERRAIEEALERHGGDKPAAAATLGISLRTLYNRLKEYGVSNGAEDAGSPSA